MSFVDIIKKSVLEQFSNSISLDKIILSLIFACIIGIFIILVYKKTYSGVVYSKSFSIGLLLLTMVTSIVIRTISSNLSLSLGMVGALSIVRFRTAIKEPTDTIFMFWGITAGIMTGAGLYLDAVIASLCIGVLYFVGSIFGFKLSRQYLFILKYDIASDDEIITELKKLNKFNIKSKSIVGNDVELTFEIGLKNQNLDMINEFAKIPGVVSANAISYKNDFGA